MVESQGQMSVHKVGAAHVLEHVGQSCYICAVSSCLLISHHPSASHITDKRENYL